VGTARTGVGVARSSCGLTQRASGRALLTPVTAVDPRPTSTTSCPRCANWRVHPKAQQEALAGVLDHVGWVRQVLVNKRTDHVVDGHLRVDLARARGEGSIPVTVRRPLDR
jgi:hypothetical protein